MSLNQIINDNSGSQVEDWKNIKCNEIDASTIVNVINITTNDLTANGQSTFSNALFNNEFIIADAAPPANLWSGARFYSGGPVLENYDTSTIALSVNGTFVVTPFDINVKLTRIGRMVFMDIPDFVVTLANQNSGGQLLLSGSLTPTFEPISVFNDFFQVTDNSGSNRASKIEWDGSDFYIGDGFVSLSFVKGSADVAAYLPQTIKWVL